MKNIILSIAVLYINSVLAEDICGKPSHLNIEFNIASSSRTVKNAYTLAISAKDEMVLSDSVINIKGDALEDLKGTYELNGRIYKIRWLGDYMIVSEAIKLNKNLCRINKKSGVDHIQSLEIQ